MATYYTAQAPATQVTILAMVRLPSVLTVGSGAAVPTTGQIWPRKG